MKSGTKDKVKGAVHQTKGKVKEVVGKATDNPKLEATGRIEQLKGKAQAKIGQIKRCLGRAERCCSTRSAFEAEFNALPAGAIG